MEVISHSKWPSFPTPSPHFEIQSKFCRRTNLPSIDFREQLIIQLSDLLCLQTKKSASCPSFRRWICRSILLSMLMRTLLQLIWALNKLNQSMKPYRQEVGHHMPWSSVKSQSKWFTGLDNTMSSNSSVWKSMWNQRKLISEQIKMEILAKRMLLGNF